MGITRKSRLGSSLFFGIFAAVGLGFLFMSVIPTLHEAYVMRSWVPVDAHIQTAQLHTYSNDGTTYQAKATYQYSYNGQRYQGNRVNHTTGNDNIGSYQQEMAEMLKHRQSTRLPLTIWVDPANPDQSIIDRDIRWEMLAFKLLFVVLFGGVGIGGVLFSWLRQRGEVIVDSQVLASSPWLSRTEWAMNGIMPDEKNGRWAIVGFATFWNLVSSPILFILPKELEKQNFAALIALLFPLVGLLLITMAIKQFLGWKRFGPAPLHMNPFPGAIGGNVGGNVDIPLPYDDKLQVSVKLNLLYSYIDRSGKDSERKQRLIWETSGIAHTENHNGGTRIFIKFDIPEGMQASEMPAEKYHLWQLKLHAAVDGVDFARTYEIPVFSTGKKSIGIKETTSETADTLNANYEEIGRLIDPQQLNGGTEWLQAAGRNISMAFGLIGFGSIFAGAGIFLFHEGIWLMAPIFLLIGLLVIAGGIYTGTNSLYVRIEGNTIHRIRRVLGITINRQSLERNNIEGLFYHSSASSGDTAFYSIYIKLPDAEYAIAEGFKGQNQAKLALETLASLTGLPPMESKGIRPRIRLGKKPGV
jgi:hypothetical protein